MIQTIKTNLLNEPEIIANILYHYDFYHININYNRISFANSEDGNRNAISLWLDDKLYVKDFVRNIEGDIFSFIIKARGSTFYDVVNVCKKELGIDTFEGKKKIEPFGGLAKRIKRKKGILEYKTYPESVLDKYEKAFNLKFYSDYISFDTQKKFGIRYDTTSNSIAIPIRNPVGELIGCKLRRNYKVSENESKYIYDIPCPASQTLYGYSQNYDSLYGSDVIIGEAEKFVMQCDSYGYHNALGIGSSSLSLHQCRLILSLNPTSITLMMDVGLDKNTLNKNLLLLKSYNRMMNTNLYYWDGKGFDDKMSATDKGKSEFEKALSERKNYQCLTEEESL